MKSIYTFGLLVFLLAFGCLPLLSAPVDSLAMRVTKGTSQGRIQFREVDSDNGNDFFRLSVANPVPHRENSSEKVLLIEGNSPLSMAVGLNHYLRYVAGIHISWDNPAQELPAVLPLPDSTIYRETRFLDRYYLNYCTFSYSMPFWDEQRWMQELDWMALHGINMALSLTGVESVWKRFLTEKGYSYEEIVAFIPGPAYMAWWLMNNLEGWGGPLPPEWFENREALQKKIVSRMRELGIEPVFPGFSGMMPSDSGEKLGIDISDTGRWCGFRRPGFLSPEDPRFAALADDYYRNLNDLYGPASFYAMDPFHEGGDIGEINLAEAGHALYSAMKRANPESKWVIQSWQANPRKQMTDTVPPGDLIVLDLYSEKIPKWERVGGYAPHQWLYCMLLNFGGNVGMHGRMDNLISGFKRASSGEYSSSMKGVGATPEGIENNPVMYELLYELPWLPADFDLKEWLSDYLKARYGKAPDDNVTRAWQALCNTVYNAPADYRGEGTVESLICARPSLHPRSASTWGSSSLFYSPDSTSLAARLMDESKDKYEGSQGFLYDLIDVNRQANADRANRLINRFSETFESGNKEEARNISEEFLQLLLQQDSLLSILPHTQVDTWLDKAGALAGDDNEARRLYRRNAAMLITVWGDSVAANHGGLNDYSHREWGGIIRELYYPRWQAFFASLLDGAPEPDYYQMELEWVRSKEE